MANSIKVAVVQSEPDWYNLQGSVKKAIKLIIEAAEGGAELIAFPEVFIPGYPLFLWNNAANVDRNSDYIRNSLSYDSPEFQSIIDTIKEYPINVVLGLSERYKNSVYIAQCIIDKTGEIVLKRRKLKPTHVERVMYGDGRPSDTKNVENLTFNEAGARAVGGLNCWEHFQPLLTFNSACQHEEIHVGSWPVLSDSGPYYSQQAAGSLVSASAYALQTQSYYLFACAIATDKILDKIGGKMPEFFSNALGCSCIFAPDGGKITKDTAPDFDGVIFHDLDMDYIANNKHLVDVVGHYSRPDIISLNVHDSNQELYHNELQ